MEAQGFRVLRFWDNQVFQETQAVLEVILQALEKRISPHPNLPPKVGNPLSSKLDVELTPPQAEEGANTQAEEEANTPSLARSAGEAWPVLSSSKEGGGAP